LKIVHKCEKYVKLFRPLITWFHGRLVVVVVTDHQLSQQAAGSGAQQTEADGQHGEPQVTGAPTCCHGYSCLGEIQSNASLFIKNVTYKLRLEVHISKVM